MPNEKESRSDLKRNKIGLVLAAAAILAVVGIFGFVLGRSQPVVKKTADKSTTSKSTGKSTEDSTDDSKTPEPGKSTKTIILYFSDSNAQLLVSETRDINLADGDALYRSAINELIIGPEKAGLIRTIPEAMSVQNLSLTDGVLSVDFGSTLLSQFPRGSTAENMFIYSLANTLTEFPEVKGVRFLAGGQTVSSRDINNDLTQVFPRDESLIAK